MIPDVYYPFEVTTEWGKETILASNQNTFVRCLKFKKGEENVLHFHIQKDESLFIQSGKFVLRCVDTRTGAHKEIKLPQGSVVVINHGTPHQIKAEEDGEIFETSFFETKSDIYRLLESSSVKNG